MLVGSETQMDEGFRSGAAKLAFLAGAVDGDASVPLGVLALLRTRDVKGATDLAKGARLMVGDAHLSETDFLTDRGPRKLPAWQLESDDTIGSIWVLEPDLAQSQWMPPNPPGRPAPFHGQPHRARTASIASDDRTLHFRFVGAPEGRSDYPSAEVIESETALVILPTIEYREPFGPHAVVTAVGQMRSVTVQLEQPLGARVLIDLDASAVAVID
ncbi:MAG TPA: hypothetical protein VKR27_02770 [Acidimicrobiales bacterium]|nr:hypothetical protein [Acidimicrobiales bacterium]